MTASPKALRLPMQMARRFAVVDPVMVPPPDPDDHVVGHPGVIRDFVQAVRDGSEPESVSHRNINSLAMVFGAIESADTG